MGAHDDFYLFKKPDSTSVTLLPCDPRAERVATSISYWQSKESTWLPADEKKLLIEYYELGSNVNKRGSFYTDIKFRKEGTGKYRLTSGSLHTMNTALNRNGEPYPRKDRTTAKVDRSRSRSADGKEGKEKEPYGSASQLSTSNSAAGSGAQSGGIDPRVQTGFAGPSDSAGTTAGYDSYRPGPDSRAERGARGPVFYDNRGGNYGGGGSNDYRNFQDRTAGNLHADQKGWLYTITDGYSDYLYHSDGTYVHDSSFSGQGTYYYMRANGDLLRRDVYQLYRY